MVSVKKMGKHITNSPFKINVCEREVGDAKKVKVSGNALKEGKTHVDNTFTVDTRNAGKSRLIKISAIQVLLDIQMLHIGVIYHFFTLFKRSV